MLVPGIVVMVVAVAALAALASIAYIAIARATMLAAYVASLPCGCGGEPDQFESGDLDGAVQVTLVDFLIDEHGFDRAEAERRVADLFAQPTGTVDAVGYAFHTVDDSDDDCECSPNNLCPRHGGPARYRGAYAASP